MTDSLTHRGPDEAGYFIKPGLELGMRRLSIIDVKDGQQPVTDESGEIIVIFNGEIYNYRELRKELQNQGHIFKSSSDTEVIAHLYEDLGADFLNKLRGMFAIAIWDNKQKSLLLARDRFGKKPLVYKIESDGEMVFASEIKAILQATNNRPGVDLSEINHVLAFGNSGTSNTVYQGIKKLTPGSFLKWQDGNIKETKYWTPDFSNVENWSEKEAKRRVFTALDDSIKVRLVSERPIGSFLSGGIDSTIVTALMVKNYPGTVSTFSIGFDNQNYNESKYAKAIANYLKTDHHELIIKPDPEVLIRGVAKIFDEPFADSSAIPTLMLSDFARKSVVVALSGDGGDEVFGGYDRYQAIPLLQKTNFALGALSPFSNLFENVFTKIGSRRLARLSREFRYQLTLASRYCSAMSLVTLDSRETILSENAKSVIRSLNKPEADYLRLWSIHYKNLSNNLSTMQTMDILNYLSGDILTKVDITSMAKSLEVRSPLLDQDVFEVASKLPQSLKIRGGQTKYLLKKIAYDLAPKELIDRPKMGFGIPRAEWLRGPLNELMHDLLSDSTFRNRGWFNQTSVSEIIAQHERGLNRDHLIWPVLMIELWARTWVH